MANKAVVLAVSNQKGGTGKTTTCENLGIGLAQEGKKVLLYAPTWRDNSFVAAGYKREGSGDKKECIKIQRI